MLSPEPNISPRNECSSSPDSIGSLQPSMKSQSAVVLVSLQKLVSLTLGIISSNQNLTYQVVENRKLIFFRYVKFVSCCNCYN